MRAFKAPQGSDAWLVSRIGRITCSRLGDVMATLKRKDGEAACRRDYRRELVAERLTRRTADHYVSRAMETGTEREPFARMLYEAETQAVVEQVGFVLHPKWDWFGGSPDGVLSGGAGGCELKAPTEIVHLSYIEDINLLIEAYKWQALGCLIVCEADFWDIASFNPFFPDAMKLVRTRLTRDEFAVEIAQIEAAVPAFHLEIEAEIAALGQPPTKFDVPPQPPPEAEYDDDKSFADNCAAFIDDAGFAP